VRRRQQRLDSVLNPGTRLLPCSNLLGARSLLSTGLSTAGQLRCSYRAYNDMDEVEAAHSLAFDCEGGTLFCGFSRGLLRSFRLERPGRWAGAAGAGPRVLLCTGSLGEGWASTWPMAEHDILPMGWQHMVLERRTQSAWVALMCPCSAGHRPLAGTAAPSWLTRREARACPVGPSWIASARRLPPPPGRKATRSGSSLRAAGAGRPGTAR